MRVAQALRILNAKAYGIDKALLSKQIKGFFIDSREVRREGLFFAIKGAKVDGHKFVEEAIKRGALVAVVEEKVNEFPSLFVPDTKEALLTLAHFYKRKFDVMTIAVTGTNGKTTTKDMIAHILSKKASIVKATKSRNNLLGVPLTIGDLKRETKFLILEMETNTVEGTRRLCEIALPQIGVITNIAPAHLKDTKNVKGVYQEKRELAKSLPENGKLILNCDSAWTMKAAKSSKASILTFGMRKKADFFAESLKMWQKSTRFLLNGRWWVNLSLAGVHNVYNALATLATIHSLGMDVKWGCECLSDFKPQALRMQFLQRGGVRVVNDAYNANPHSVKAALDYLCAQKGRRIFVFGQMHELGKREALLHEWVGRMVARSRVDAFFAIGALSEHATKGAKREGMREVFHFLEKEEACNYLASYIREGDFLLLKASRAIELEDLLKGLFKD
jgi:UDP-N-acetylmuramoyl-tripeptide--D-alanyl-D-alanine ligase